MPQRAPAMWPGLCCCGCGIVIISYGFFTMSYHFFPRALHELTTLITDELRDRSHEECHEPTAQGIVRGSFQNHMYASHILDARMRD
jgi:hypothetical protein